MTQAEAWSRLGGRWISDVPVEDEIAGIHSARSDGREYRDPYTRHATRYACVADHDQPPASDAPHTYELQPLRPMAHPPTGCHARLMDALDKLAFSFPSMVRELLRLLPEALTAELDRLVHSAYQLNLKGESMRKRHRPLTQTGHCDS